MPLFKRRVNDEYSFRRIVTIFSIICLILSVACYAYYLRIQTTIKEENQHYLSEISSRITNNVSSTIENNFAVLKTLASVIKESKATSFSQIETIMQNQIEFWPFDDILLIDDAAVAYDSDMHEVTITGDSFLRSLTADEQAIFPSQVINNEERLIFTYPLKDTTLDDRKIIALATTYSPKEFDDILSMDSFDSQSYSQIVTSKGTIAIHSNSVAVEEFGYNILESIRLMDVEASEKVNVLKNAMMEQKSGQFDFIIHGKEMYLVYTPLTSQDWYLFTFVPVSIVSEKSNLLLQTTIVICAFAVIAFAALIIVLIVSFTKHKRKLEDIAYVDAVTNGPTFQYFYKHALRAMVEHPHDSAIVFTNIRSFKILNDQLGRLVCDQILVFMQEAIQEDLKEYEYVGHYSADNFVALLSFHSKEELIQRLAKWENQMEIIAKEKHQVLPAFALTYGIYIVDDKKMDMVDMVDRARVALRESKDLLSYNDVLSYAFYDEDIRHRMIRDKHLEDMMEKALKEDEFQVYLQPKYEIKNDRIAGAEALVRWISKEEGMIYPDSFIPLFERNGFIVKLDLWMFEQVCKLIKKWIDNGDKPVKISVNCSRVHLKDEDFLERYNDIFKKYDIPANYLELELTETMFFDNAEHLAKIIDDIHEIGFGCSMDDFGSGYSSLNLLQNIHVDTLKLDRIFFHNEFEKKPRNKAIVDCILQMAQSLSMATVAEGIEDKNQVEVLKILGCDYIQGYVYAKPMPVSEFEALLFPVVKKVMK